MKAIHFEQYGEPTQVLTVQQCPVPQPAKGEVRVRILASPINPSDLLFVRGHYAGVEPHFPAPVGFEGVGIVDALGPQVQRPVPGQHVIVRNGQGGNWADAAVVSAQDLLPAPDDLTDEQADQPGLSHPYASSCWPSPKASGYSNLRLAVNWAA